VAACGSLQGDGEGVGVGDVDLAGEGEPQPVRAGLQDGLPDPDQVDGHGLAQPGSGGGPPIGAALASADIRTWRNPQPGPA
jgi:hypothetical protein